MGQGFKFSIKEKGPGLKYVQKALAELRDGRGYVKVGVIGAQANALHDGGLTNAELAAVHEYGTRDGHIPERSFIRSSMEKNQAKYFSTLKGQIGQAVEGKTTIQKTLGILGLMAATDIKNNVTQGAGIPPPLQPATVARKGSTRPLVDTGRMLDSVSYAVKLDGGDDE